ncbi:MAG: YjgP/YjgQ family permease [Candidatus Atribacteria bacterium]|nr:YjgP/YjgQ family permease [Candidatus Atribacteria bacterium]
MTILDRYVLKQVGFHFLSGVALFVALLSAGDLLFRLAKMWLQQGITGWKVMVIFIYSLPSFLVYVFPMAILLSVLLTVGRMSGDSELVALRAGGVSLWRFTIPFLLFAIWICAGTILLQERVLPYTSLRLKDMWEESSIANWLLQENTFFRDTTEGGVERIFYVRNVNTREALLEGVVVQEYNKGILQRIINADRALNREGKWIFEEGVAYEVNDRGEVERVVHFAREEVKTEEDIKEVLKTQKRPQEMSFAELKSYITRERARGQQTDRLEVILWQKTAIPFACLVFVLLGTSLGIVSPRAGRALGIGLSVLVVFGYYVLFSVTSTLAEGGVFSPILGTWFSNIVGLAMGGAILWWKERK